MTNFNAFEDDRVDYENSRRPFKEEKDDNLNVMARWAYAILFVSLFIIGLLILSAQGCEAPCII